MADSASESDSGSLDGVSHNNIQQEGPHCFQPPSPVTREQLQKRIESLQQQNRVLNMELETYKLRVKSLQVITELTFAVLTLRYFYFLGRKQIPETSFGSHPSQGRAGGRVHIQHFTEEDSVPQEGERKPGLKLRARGGMSHQRPQQETEPVETGEGPAGAHTGAGAGVSRQQADEED